MGFFKKDRKMFGMSFLVRMMIFVLLIIIIGSSVNLLFADWGGTSLDTYTMGKVGIGLANPWGKLDISVNAGEPALVLRGIDNNNSLWYCPKVGQGYCNPLVQDGDSVLTYSAGSINTGNLVIGNWSNTATGLRIMANGNLKVGINNNAANHFVEVRKSLAAVAPDSSYPASITSAAYDYYNDGNNPSWSGVQMSFYGKSWTGTRFGLTAGSLGYGELIFQNTSNAVIGTNGMTSIHVAPFSTILATFHYNGNIGIGTTTPAYKLDVAGTIRASSYACTSDSRYKKNVALYKNALEKVLGLRGVTFFWNAEKYKDRSFGRERQIGFIAQEVEKVIPEIVYTDDKGFKTMSYDRLTTVLVEAVKELKAEKDGEIALMKKDYDDKIVKLESENETLKADNAELKQKLVKLDSVIDRLVSLERKMEKQEGLSFAER